MSGKTGTTSQTADVPVAAFQELVAQYHHRLLSLEADLKDRARARLLSSSAFAKRVRRLKKIHRSLNSLQRLCLAESPAQLSRVDIGLPVMDACTPAEHDVCKRFLEEREAEVTSTHEQVARVYKWLVEAVSGRTGTLRLTFRLSKLRRMIHALEKETTALEEVSKSTSTHIDRLLGARRAATVARDTIEGLMQLFQDLDATIARVAKLRAAVKKEQEKTDAMEAWLRHHESAMLARPVMMPPPTPLAMTQAMEAAGNIYPSYRRTVRRRQAVQEFLDDVVHGGPRQPSDKELRRAARTLRQATRNEALG